MRPDSSPTPTALSHEPKKEVPPDRLSRIIRSIRGQRVILDSDLAKIYGVETRGLNQAAKRNLERFPAEFMFDLTRDEILGISQSVTSLRKLKFSKQVRAFTEHGALMVANVLNSPRAAAMSVYVIRAFVKMREDLAANAAILRRLAEIDKSCLSMTPLFATFIRNSGRCLSLRPNQPSLKSDSTFGRSPRHTASDESLPTCVCRKRDDTLCRSPRPDLENSQFPTPAEGDWILFMKTDKKQTGEAEKPKDEKAEKK